MAQICLILDILQLAKACLNVISFFFHYTGMSPEQVQETGAGAMGTNMLHRNVDTVCDSERNQDQLLPIVLIQSPVPVSVLFP